MRDHASPSSRLRHLTRLNGFSDGSNLVDLQKETVARLLLNALLHSLGIRHQKIITSNTDTHTHTQISNIDTQITHTNTFQT